MTRDKKGAANHIWNWYMWLAPRHDEDLLCRMIASAMQGAVEHALRTTWHGDVTFREQLDDCMAVGLERLVE